MAQTFNSDRPNFPDSGSDTTRSKNPSTWSFHERYASDSEFRRQIDEGRRRRAEEMGTTKLKKSLAMTRGEGPKIY